MENKWLLQFLANYNGESPEAKSLEAELQKNYKGNAYVGWATMERLTYQQDPFATFEVIIGDRGTPLFSDHISITSFNRKEGKDTVDTMNTESARVVNFVRVKLTFLDKVFVEDYPIQDKSYQAQKFVDSNDVNKAVQRAKAKVASRGTGLALKLYEGNDLQFDPPEKTVAPPTKQPINVSNVSHAEVVEVVNDITTNFDKYKVGIEEVNKAIKSKYGWEITSTMTKPELLERFSEFADPRITLQQIKRKAGAI
jgi:hypothetical protein